jgi:hypothetical protein
MRQMKVMSKRDIIRPSDSVPKETRNLKKQSGIDSLSYKTKHTSKFLIGYFDVNFIMLIKRQRLVDGTNKVNVILMFRLN